MTNQESNQQFNSFSSVSPLGGFDGPEKDQVLLFWMMIHVLPLEFFLPGACLLAG